MKEWTPDFEYISESMDERGYDRLTSTQTYSFAAGVLGGGNHLVIAPTGNGKTFVAETKIRKSIDNNRRVAYLVPSIQLKTGKKQELSEVLDADIRAAGEDDDAYDAGDITVATFEGFYQKLIKHPSLARGYDLAVLDDFHILYDDYRGFTLEKVITGLKVEDIPMLAMSATIGSPEKLSDWIDADLIRSLAQRQVPLKERVFVQDSDMSKIDQIANIVTDNESESPFIIFNNSRKNTERRAKRIAQKRGWSKENKSAGLGDFMSGKDAEEEIRPGPNTKTVLSDLEDRLPSITNEVDRIARMIEWGVAYHHGGLPNELKNYIEELFKDQKIDCLASTTTVASGFDSPAKTALVADYSRFDRDENTNVDMPVYEIEQMFGRAGRPDYGYDEGNAWILVKSESVAEKYQSPRELEDVKSNVAQDELMRKFLLELIVGRSGDPEEINKFVDQTLFEYETVDQVYGLEFDTDEFVRENIQWLASHDFIERTPTGKLRTEELGKEAVKYGFRQFGRYKLQGIEQLLNWIKDNPDFSRPELLTAMARFGDHSLYPSDEHDMSAQFENKLSTHNIDPDSKFAKTAGVIEWHWCRGSNLDTAVVDSGMRAEYTATVASKLSELYDLTEVLLHIASVDVPEWWDTFELQLKHGVSKDHARMVEEINDLGRSRVDNLDKWVRNELDEDDDDIPLEAMLLEFFEGSNPDQIRDVLKSTVDDIGPVLGKRVAAYLLELDDSDPPVN